VFSMDAPGSRYPKPPDLAHLEPVGWAEALWMMATVHFENVGGRIK
jgi:hypothetical protein